MESKRKENLLRQLLRQQEVSSDVHIIPFRLFMDLINSLGEQKKNCEVWDFFAWLNELNYTYIAMLTETNLPLTIIFIVFSINFVFALITNLCK